MLQEPLTHYIEHPERLDAGTLYELRMMVARYPWCHTARLLLLNNLYLQHSPDFGPELRKAALCLPDRRVLFYLIQGTPSARPATAAPRPEPGVDRTLALIDAFLSSLPQERSPLNLPGDAATDYATLYLLSEEKPQEDGGDKEEAAATEELSDTELAPRLRGQELIDRFIDGGCEKFDLQLTPPDGQEHNDEEDEYPDDGEGDTPPQEGAPATVEEEFFTETLARIYVKQKKYRQALEILRKLNLEYPNKNRYFADQIRFLEKVVNNTKTE